MEEIKRFKTVIRDLEHIGRRRVPVYKLLGYIEVISGYNREVRNVKRPLAHNWKNASVIECWCTQDQYDKFQELAEKNYPKLCEFNIE